MNHSSIDPTFQFNIEPLSPEEYESYVATVVSHFEAFRGANIYRNRKFPGIRQPGTYEIDIAIEFAIAGALGFLVIIECKNWKRPVDRPVVQKLIQTAEAVGAHKSVVVSPMGFTEEAVSVAQAHHIALWVLAREKFEVVLFQRQTTVERRDYRQLLYHFLRRDLLFSLGLSPLGRRDPFLLDWFCLPRYIYWTGENPMPIHHTVLQPPGTEQAWLHRLPMLKVFDHLSRSDQRLATAQVSCWIDEHLHLGLDTPAASAWRNALRERVRALNLTDHQLGHLVDATVSKNASLVDEALCNEEAESVLERLLPSWKEGIAELTLVKEAASAGTLRRRRLPP